MKFWASIDFVHCMDMALLNVNEMFFPSKCIYLYIFLLDEFFPIRFKLFALLPHQVFADFESGDFDINVETIMPLVEQDIVIMSIYDGIYSATQG